MADNKIQLGPVATARLRHLRIAPRKARLVADVVRGMEVGQALAQLGHTRRAAAEPLFKLVKSARDNADSNPNNAGLIDDADRLIISKLTVDGGPILWRWRPRAYGRASRIRKRSCHITVELSLS